MADCGAYQSIYLLFHVYSMFNCLADCHGPALAVCVFPLLGPTAPPHERKHVINKLGRPQKRSNIASCHALKFACTVLPRPGYHQIPLMVLVAQPRPILGRHYIKGPAVCTHLLPLLPHFLAPSFQSFPELLVWQMHSGLRQHYRVGHSAPPYRHPWARAGGHGSLPQGRRPRSHVA